MWPKLAAFLLLGYLSMGRTFAYWGVPQVQVFIGEVALAAFLFCRPGAVFGRWIGGMARGTVLAEVGGAFYIFFVYGIFEVLRGIAIGYSPLRTAQNFAFNYYPLYLFVGLWVGMNYPGFIRRLVRPLAWWHGLYGALWVVWLRQIDFAVPGGFISFFGQPGGSAVALLALLAFEPQWRRVWPLLLLNAFVLLGTEVRAEWVAFLVGLFTWGVVTLRVGRLLNLLGSAVALLWIAYLVDFQLPGARGGELSTKGVIGRALAPFNEDLAAQYTDTAESAAGTVSWRTEWWAEIWASVHADQFTALVGHGYGFPLASLATFVGDQETRTPHNIFYYLLGYSGWLGVAIFFVFQLAIVHLLWRAYRLTGQPFGLILWAAILTQAFFGNVFETPFGAIPFYLVIGISFAPAVVSERDRRAVAASPAQRRTRVQRPSPRRLDRLPRAGPPTPRTAHSGTS